MLSSLGTLTVFHHQTFPSHTSGRGCRVIRLQHFFLHAHQTAKSATTNKAVKGIHKATAAKVRTDAVERPVGRGSGVVLVTTSLATTSLTSAVVSMVVVTAVLGVVA